MSRKPEFEKPASPDTVAKPGEGIRNLQVSILTIEKIQDEGFFLLPWNNQEFEGPKGALRWKRKLLGWKLLWVPQVLGSAMELF